MRRRRLKGREIIMAERKFAWPARKAKVHIAKSISRFDGILAISHLGLEPHGSHWQWKGDELDAPVSTQNVSGCPKQFSDALGIEETKVTVTSDYEGGGFGSKFTVDEWGLACARMPKE